ncbi:MAG TPA: hypothetical protein VLM79_03250 [Kofleriaceae bacterium]|nr:hypothetical protein [Kofleriaceae bacterium]
MLIAVAGGPADADDDAGTETALQVHGFASQGALLTSDNNYLARTKRGSLEFTEAGINFTKSFDDRLSAGLQLFARDLGPAGSYTASFDWLYLDYHWQDWLGVRAGRVKLPYGLYNDTSDIDAAQPVILLPQSVYPAVNRNFFLAQTGLELYGYHSLGTAGALDYHIYAGTLFLSIPDSNGLHIESLDVPYIAGARVVWETPVEGLRIAGSALSGEIDGAYTALAMSPPTVIALELKATNWLSSIEYVKDGVLVAAEYGRSIGRTTLGTATTHVTGEQAYGLAGYRWRPWLQGTAYFSLLHPDVDQRSGREHHQYDTAGAVRFDLSPHWIIKLEAHFLRGTAALSSQLNDSKPLSELVNQWWLLAAKTTVYF